MHIKIYLQYGDFIWSIDAIIWIFFVEPSKLNIVCAFLLRNAIPSILWTNKYTDGLCF